MKKCSAIGVFLLVSILSSSCQQSSRIESNKICVSTSVFPIYDMVRNIGGEHIEVFYIVPIGANPHTYEPVPSAIQKLQKADLFLGIHPEFDGWIGDYLPESANQIFLQSEDHEGEEDDHEHDHGGEVNSQHGNPHIWLSVRNAIQLVEKMVEIFSSMDEENRAYYRKNQVIYVDQLNQLDDKIKGLFDTVETRKFIQWHPAWDYFAEDYDLEIVGTIESGHGDEPSIKEFKMLIEKAIQEHVKIVVIGLNLESTAAEALEKEINGKRLRLDTIGNPSVEVKSSYLKMMYTNAKLLAETLKRAD